MPSSLAPSRSMPRRLCVLKKWVRNSTAMQSSVSKVWPSSISLHSVLSGVRWTRRAYQVEPISTRLFAASTFMYVVIPQTRPAASRTAKGSMLPAACSARRRSISFVIAAGSGIEVYQSFHSSPSCTATASSAACASARGSSVACFPASVIGGGQLMGEVAQRSPLMRLPVVTLHEDELLEQRHVLLVLQQGADQGRHGDLVVLALQRLERNVLGDQELQPIEQLARARLLLQPREVAHVVEVIQRRAEQFFLEAGEVHVDDALHRVGVGELDVVEEAAAQERVVQLLLVVRGDEDDRPVRRLDELARLVDVELHAVDLAQQVVREFDVGLVDLVDQQHDRRLGRERLPEDAA